jgi:hypothetical protein
MPLTRKDYDRTIALRILAVMKAKRKLQVESYFEDCAADRANGHRPHYCFHGTSLWTDYDNICGGCEDGDSAYSSPGEAGLYAEAIYKARRYQELTDDLATVHMLKTRYYSAAPELSVAILRDMDRFSYNFFVMPADQDPEMLDHLYNGS